MTSSGPSSRRSTRKGSRNVERAEPMEMMETLSRRLEAARSASLGATSRVDGLHALLWAEADGATRPILATARQHADAVFRCSGAGDAADAHAVADYAGVAVAGLAADGRLDGKLLRAIASGLADARDEPLSAAALELCRRVPLATAVRELPPLVGVEIALRLLVELELVTGASVWTPDSGGLRSVVSVGIDDGGTRTRLAAWAAIHRRGYPARSGSLHTVVIRRFGEPCAALVTRLAVPREEIVAHLDAVTDGVAALLEREQLLGRSAGAQAQLVSAGERRLSRLGFDLHDGPIQDVLALGAEVHMFRSDVAPLIEESRRALVDGRFEDLFARVNELDVALREIAQSLESRSIVARPLTEVLHREVDAFAARCDIDVRLDIRGDQGSLTQSQRIAVYRCIQEALANVREHSGAAKVDIQVRNRRSAIHVTVTDDGRGFDVRGTVAGAAQRGRLGIVGIGERVRMLGGVFQIDSAPGGPTRLSFSLPRVVVDQAVSAGQPEPEPPR